VIRHRRRNERTESVHPRRPPARGWIGRGRGESFYVQPPAEWRGSTVPVCGLLPFGAGPGTPMVRDPVGRLLTPGSTVCTHAITWFQRANSISNPSIFTRAIPGVVKTSFIMRLAVGLAGYGTIPLVLGDTRPDYTDMVRALGGQVIQLGRNR